MGGKEKIQLDTHTNTHTIIQVNIDTKIAGADLRSALLPPQRVGVQLGHQPPKTRAVEEGHRPEVPRGHGVDEAQLPRCEASVALPVQRRRHGEALRPLPVPLACGQRRFRRAGGGVGCGVGGDGPVLISVNASPWLSSFVRACVACGCVTTFRDVRAKSSTPV